VGLPAPAAPAQPGRDSWRGEQWALDAIRADAAHRVSTGAGVLVAVVDTGVQYTHPDLVGSVLKGPDLVDGDNDPDDSHGHGTHVAGIIVAHEHNGIGIAGAAPGARVLAIRVLDHADGDTAREAAGIDAAVAAGAQVINLSLSLQPSLVAQLFPGSALVLALERATRAGIVVVAAAGNDGAPLCAQPQLKTRILCVGAVDRGRNLARYSNYGQGVDLVAPGGDAENPILSTAPGGDYAPRVGTSQAAAHVAAAAALLVALGLRGAEVIDRLKRTAVSLGEPTATGSGLLDAAAAVAGLRRPSGASATAPRLSAWVPPRVQLETVDRRGLLIRCRASRNTTCRARVVRRGWLVAEGEAGVAAGAATAVHAWLTPDGRRVLMRARRPLILVRVTIPGARPVNRLTMLVP
jgi:subtilisin family serine protease